MCLLSGAAIWLPLCLEGGHATRMEGGGEHRVP